MPKRRVPLLLSSAVAALIGAVAVVVVAIGMGGSWSARDTHSAPGPDRGPSVLVVDPALETTIARLIPVATPPPSPTATSWPTGTPPPTSTPDPADAIAFCTTATPKGKICKRPYPQPPTPTAIPSCGTAVVPGGLCVKG